MTRNVAHGAEARRRVDELRHALEELLRNRDARTSLERDPLGIVHTFRSAADREVVGLLASMLAFGNVETIRSKVREALERLGGAPARRIEDDSLRALRRRFDGFVHRVYRGEHIAEMLHRTGKVRKRDGSLGATLQAHLDDHRGDLRESLALLADELRGPDPAPGLRHLLADPRSNSACKRWHLYLRWMVRPADGVDLGLWPLPASMLQIPLDTHVLRISQNLGLTKRKDASWRTSSEVTAALAQLDPDDPVRYDFAICHLGVSRKCPRRQQPDLCAGCVLHSVCRRR